MKREILVCGAVFLIPSWLPAQTAEVLQEVSAVSVAVRYFECVDPTREEICVCAKEEEKETKCQPCNDWQTHYVETELFAREFAEAYGPDRPLHNIFLAELSDRVFGTSYPATPAGYPITTTMLYNNPEGSDWIAMDAGQSLAGAVAVWPGGAGWVVSGGAGDARILYPSFRRDGELVIGRLEVLAGSAATMFVVPRSWLLARL